MIKKIIRAYLINVAVLYVISMYIGGFHLADGIKSLLMVGAGFTAIHLLLRPILGFITGPFNFLTFGLIGLVIDAGLLYAMTLFLTQIWISKWFFPGFSYESFSIAPMNLEIIAVTLLCALIINLLRNAIMSLCD